MNEQSMQKQCLLGEGDTVVKPSQVNHVISYRCIVHIKLKMEILKEIYFISSSSYKYAVCNQLI